jgi:phosphoserine phosphatase
MEEDNLRNKSFEKSLTANIRTVIIVRHAESMANSKGIYQGQTYDTDLSRLGKKQAKSLAKRAKEIGIKRIISSPLKRTYQTAHAVSQVCDCPIEISELIIETNHGDWEGKNKRSIKSLYPDIYGTWLRQPSKTNFPNGEVFTQTFERTSAFLSATEFSDDTLIITHDNVIRILVTLANGWSLDEIWTHNIEPAALNYFEINKIAGKNKLKLLKLNDNKHLKGVRADLSKHAL